MRKNIFIFLGLLALSIFVSWSSFWGQYTQRDTVSINAFPRNIGEWTSREIPISDSDYEILETRNAFSRIYHSPQGEEVMLFIVYSQNNRKVSHPPEICYTGSGATILNKTGMALDLGPKNGELGVQRLTAQAGNGKLMVYYWFKVGDSFTSSYWKQQAMIALRSLSGQPVGSAMIRLSLEYDGTNTVTADRTAQKFARLILSDVERFLP